MTIIATLTIDEILSKFPQKSQKLAQAMLNRGLHCVGCGAATWETLEAGMMSHGFTPPEIADFVEELNQILLEESDGESISLTEAAAHKFKMILEQEKKAGWAMRFGFKRGGCSGFEYVLDYSKAAKETDEVFQSYGVEIHVDQEMLPSLIGCEIDYIDGLNASGFRISNPQAKSSCGCGKSQKF